VLLTIWKGDVAWYERWMEPWGTRWTPTTQEVLEDISGRITRYDPSGREGDCFESVTFTGHSGVPGVIPLGDLLVSIDVIERQREVNERRRKEGKRPIDFAQPEKEFLEEIGRYLCSDNATVRFVYCSSGAGEKGKRLREWLENVLNRNVNVVLYDTGVKWSWGTVRKVRPRKGTEKQPR